MRHKRNDPIELKVKRCLDSIGNIHPDLYENLYVELQNNPLATSATKLRKYLVEVLKLPTSGRNTKKYWLSRGWSEVDAIIKTKLHNKNRNYISPYSREFWINRINPNTGLMYTIDEADLERNSRRPTKKEYWIKKGYSYEDAFNMAEKTKKENSKKGFEKIQELSTEIKRANNPLTIDYWVLRGFNENEAKQKISEQQNKFSLEICIQKYGKQEGEKRWKERQIKWQNSLLNKTPDETSLINIKKNPYRLELYDSIDDLIETLSKKNIKVYKTEEEFFEKVLDDLSKNITKTYWKPEKYVNSLPKVQFEILGITKNYFLEKIKNKFNTGAILLKNNGSYSNYVMWVDEGLLRSSFEIYFYNQIKKINGSAIISIDESYPNSKMRYDFLIENGDYIEICPIKQKKSNHVKKKEYNKTLNKKIKLFNPVLLSSTEEINQYIEKYKNEFIRKN